jgi:hypothetical protein
MKITKQRLEQIIQEEINSFNASQLNESMDVDEVEEVEEYLKQMSDLLRGHMINSLKHTPLLLERRSSKQILEKMLLKNQHIKMLKISF